MIDRQYVALMARYNRWMNGKLYSACEQLSDAQRKEDRGAFFKSIHATLNHLLWGDYVWIGRFTQHTPLEKSYPAGPIGIDLYPEWQALRSARSAMDLDICLWADSISQDWLARDITWHSSLTKSEHSKPAWQLAVHLFNHQTHHRGQVTTLLSQYGIDPGETDLMRMPA